MNEIFILTDLEGVAGVTEFIQTREKGPKNDEAKLLLTKELNAAISAINEYDSNIKIHIWDGHGSGGIIKEKLLPIYSYLPPHSIQLHEYFVENNIEALLFIGQHPMSNTPNGNLAHTMSSKRVDYYKINGKEIGEFGFRAALAGEIDVPTIFISGDDLACEEAKNLIPNIITCSVKTSTGLESANNLPFNEVYRKIGQKITSALKKIEKIEPYTIDGPIIFEKRLKPGLKLFFRLKSRYLIQQLLKRNIVKRKDKRTLRFYAKNMLELRKMGIQ